MKEVNATHLVRHTTQNEAHLIINKLRFRIPIKTKFIRKWINRSNGRYIMKSKSAQFDINEAISVLQEVAKNPISTRKNHNYQPHIDVLVKVREDGLKYGDLIPDTSDIITEEDKAANIKPIVVHRSFLKERERSVKAKKKRRAEFVERFKKFDWESIK